MLTENNRSRRELSPIFIKGNQKKKSKKEAASPILRGGSNALVDCKKKNKASRNSFLVSHKESVAERYHGQ